MSFDHAKSEAIAQAEVLRLDADEDSEVLDPRLLELFLDSDGVYRWYEEDAASDVSAPTLLEALEAAEEAWEGFQLVEIRGEAVERNTEIADSYAADELEDIEDY